MAARFFCDASVSRSVPFEKSKAARPILPVMAAPCSFQRDRKSTRLNSSHSQISYAVFCLKKKKHNSIINTIMSTIHRINLIEHREYSWNLLIVKSNNKVDQFLFCITYSTVLQRTNLISAL